MPTAANSKLARVLTGLSSFKGLAESTGPVAIGNTVVQFLAQTVHVNQELSQLGDRLALLAENAYAFRRFNGLGELSRMLIDLPLPVKYEQIGLYYQALSVQKPGSRSHFEQAAGMLQRVADRAMPFYRLRALQALAANLICMGDWQSALLLYRDAARLSSRDGIRNAPMSVSLQLNLAIIKSMDGNHRDAIALLRDLGPLAQSISSTRPHIYYSYLNSLAVELGAVGRLAEAERLSQFVLRAPLASAYPEWHETKEELTALRGLRASRSYVALGQPIPVAENPVLNNVVALNSFRFGIGMTAGSSPPLLFREEARILKFKCRKETMAKQARNTNIAEKIRQMSHAERVIRLLELISSNDTTTDELAKILEIAESVAGKGKKEG